MSIPYTLFVSRLIFLTERKENKNITEICLLSSERKEVDKIKEEQTDTKT
jgi:hypothetical protein